MAREVSNSSVAFRVSWFQCDMQRLMRNEPHQAVIREIENRRCLGTRTESKETVILVIISNLTNAEKHERNVPEGRWWQTP